MMKQLISLNIASHLTHNFRMSHIYIYIIFIYIILIYCDLRIVRLSWQDISAGAPAKCQTNTTKHQLRAGQCSNWTQLAEKLMRGPSFLSIFP